MHAGNKQEKNAVSADRYRKDVLFLFCSTPILCSCVSTFANTTVTSSMPRRSATRHSKNAIPCSQRSPNWPEVFLQAMKPLLPAQVSIDLLNVRNQPANTPHLVSSFSLLHTTAISGTWPLWELSPQKTQMAWICSEKRGIFRNLANDIWEFLFSFLRTYDIWQDLSTTRNPLFTLYFRALCQDLRSFPDILPTR